MAAAGRIEYYLALQQVLQKDDLGNNHGFRHEPQKPANQRHRLHDLGEI